MLALQNELRDLRSREKEAFAQLKQLSEEFSTLKVALQSGSCFQSESQSSPSTPGTENSPRKEFVSEEVKPLPMISSPPPKPLDPDVRVILELKNETIDDEVMYYSSILASTYFNLPLSNLALIFIEYRPVRRYCPHDDVLGGY